MKKSLAYYSKALKYKLFDRYVYSQSELKEIQELDFWKDVLKSYIDWYNGDTKILYSTPSPLEEEKIVTTNLSHSAILSWFELHQKVRYLHDLQLASNSFKNLTILDVGSGPFPSALVFEDSKVYCLDPLIPQYMAAGFPIHYYDNVKFVHGYSESIPLPDNSIDVLVSVNAIDHVQNLSQTSIELERVCKQNCKFAMHVHYHKPSTTEPIEITDDLFTDLFSWVPNLTKISQSQNKMDYEVPEGESYVLWRNF